MSPDFLVQDFFKDNFWFRDVDGLFTNAINNAEILANQLERFQRNLFVDRKCTILTVVRMKSTQSQTEEMIFSVLTDAWVVYLESWSQRGSPLMGIMRPWRLWFCEVLFIFLKIQLQCNNTHLSIKLGKWTSMKMYFLFERVSIATVLKSGIWSLKAMPVAKGLRADAVARKRSCRRTIKERSNPQCSNTFSKKGLASHGHHWMTPRSLLWPQPKRICLSFPNWKVCVQPMLIPSKQFRFVWTSSCFPSRSGWAPRKILVWRHIWPWCVHLSAALAWCIGLMSVCNVQL